MHACAVNTLGAAFGKTEWKHLIVADDDVDVRYSKLLSATTQYLLDIIEDERRQLVALLNHEDTQVYILGSIDISINLFKEILLSIKS